MDFYLFIFSVEHPNFSSTRFGDTRKLKLRVPAPCKMDPAPSLIGFLMALCHLAARVGGEDGEFPVFHFDARTHARFLPARNTPNAPRSRTHGG